MPNVEIWGFPMNFLNPINGSRVEEVVTKVEVVLKDLELANISVTTIVPSFTRLADGSKRPAPFLRVIVPVSEKHLLEKLVPALQKALPDLDVEDAFINGYHQAFKEGETALVETDSVPEQTEETSGC